jgi:hypothetical protein
MHIPAGLALAWRTAKVALNLEPFTVVMTLILFTRSVHYSVMLSSRNLFIIINLMNVIFTEKLARLSHMVMTLSCSQ